MQNFPTLVARPQTPWALLQTLRTVQKKPKKYLFDFFPRQNSHFKPLFKANTLLPKAGISNTFIRLFDFNFELL